MRDEVLKFIGINEDENLSDTDLLDRLRRYRNTLHPDVHKGLEDIYNNKMAIANDLVEKFEKYVKEKMVTTLTLSKNNNKDLTIDERVFEILDLEDKNKNLEEKLKSETEKTKRLDTVIKNIDNEKNNKTINEYTNYYKSKKSDFVALTTTVGLTLILSIIEQIRSIYIAIFNIFPFDLKIFNIILFIIVILTVLKIAIGNYISYEINNLFKSILTTKIRIDFVNQFEKTQQFSELDVLEFIHEYIRSKKLLYLALKVPFNNRKDLLIDACADLFIHELFDEGIIKSYTTNTAIKSFRINSYQNYFCNWRDVNE